MKNDTRALSFNGVNGTTGEYLLQYDHGNID